MDSSKFKNYILGTILYRYLSERTEKYMNEILKNDGVTYREVLENEELEEAVREMSLDHLGYIIEPDNLFNSLVTKIKGGVFSIEDYEKAISSLIGSTVGQESESAFDKLFDDMNLQDKDLGKEVSQRTKLISKVINKVYDIDFIQGAKGTKMPRGDKNHIMNMPVFVPCLEEQQKIADFLSAFDEAITYAKQELEKWKELKKGLLQQMFV